MKKKILIVGGGFGGVKAALELAHCGIYDITLISKIDYFQYYPTLYQTATGGSRVASTIPLGEIFAGKDVEVRIDEATVLHKQSKRLECASGKHYEYDKIIFSLGMTTNYFGIPGLDAYAYTIKSLDTANEFKHHLKQQLHDTEKLDAHYVVIGAGPTGVELAGALPAYLKLLCQEEGIPPKSMHISLVEARDRVLPTLPPSVSTSVERRLKKLGVKVLTNKQVNEETADAVIINYKPLKSHTVVWTAGVMNNPFYKLNNFKLNERGRVVVDEQLSCGHDVYVIGDNAATQFCGLAQTALHDAQFVADVIKSEDIGLPVPRYKPHQPASVIPVGAKWAIFSYKRIIVSGRVGWWLRRAADLIGYHDMEPWWKAAARSMTDAIREE